MENVKWIVVLITLFTLKASFAQNQSDLQQGFQKSYLLEKDKKYVAAIDAMKAVYDESSYEVNLRLGWLCYAAGRYDASIQYYRKSIGLMPASTEPLWGILNTYLAKEDWGKVEGTYKSIVKLDPKNSTAHYKLGMIYYYRKDYGKAKKHFDVVLNLYPFDLDALIMSGWTNYFLGNMKEARVLFQKALLNTPGNASALEGLGLIK